MITGRIPAIVLLLLQINFVNAQFAVEGTVVNEKNEALSYTNIGIRGKNLGTLSNESGQFRLNIPEKLRNDTLTFYLLGYSQLHVKITDLAANKQTVFRLKQTFLKLDEVRITATKPVEKKFGIVRYNPLVHFIDGSLDQNDIFEIAQVIHLPSSSSKLTSVNLFINQSRKDSGLFRLNFYSLEKGLPSAKLNRKEILQKKEIKEGWMRFELSEENMYAQGDIVAAIEFLPDHKGIIQYEVKVGGGSRSFVRTSSLGQWQIPPHHYRLYVTALVPEKTEKIVDEEKETAPATRFYSKHVKDSFSIFVALPKNYATNKQKIYAVNYLLDANVYFDLMKEHNESILVGIGYSNAFLADSLRERDYTYPKALITDTMRMSGGAANFLDFIKQELIPYIDRNYRTDTADRNLMGHSLAGYFTLYALNRDGEGKSAFRNYIAASPSIDYANRYLLQAFKTWRSVGKENKALFITAGEEEKLVELPDLLRILKEKSHLKVRSEIYPQMAHMETAVITFRKALKLKDKK